MKPFYKSKTFWFNVFAAFAIAVEQNLGAIKPFVGDGFYLWLLIFVPVINLILRFVTNTELTRK